MSTFGLFFGAMIGGRASDLVGRKWVTVISVILFAALSVVTAQSTSGDMLLWARFFTGLGLGGALPNLLAIITEAIGAGRRNTAVGFLYAAMPVGGALASLSSYAFANPAHWQAIYYLGGLVPLLALPGLILGVPNTKPNAGQRTAAARPSVGLALWGEDRAARTVILWLCLLFALVTQYVLLNWLPSLLISKGLPRPQASIVQIAYNLLGAVGAVVAGVLIDRPGRAASTVLVFGLGILSLGVLAAAPASLGLSMAVGGFVGFAISGCQAIAYALAPSAYPTYVRGTGVGFAVAVGRVGAATGPLLAGAVIGGGAGPGKVLSLMVPLVLVAGLCAWQISRTTRRAETFAGDTDAAALAAG
jgi:AAHS family 3-hydroxyphenylpropionic acid transporter